MRKTFPYVGSAYLFLIEDNKILLQRRFNTGFEDGNYGVPAGHLDGGETAKEGCAREIKEEIGIDININDLEVVHVMHRNGEKDERIDFFMTATVYKGLVTNCEPNKCDGLDWFPLDELPNNIIDYVKVAIENYNNGVFYSEYDWNR